MDPLVGGIHAGRVDELSAAATFPVLIAATHQPGSLMRRLGRALRRRLCRPPMAGAVTGLLDDGRKHGQPGPAAGRGAGAAGVDHPLRRRGRCRHPGGQTGRRSEIGVVPLEPDARTRPGRGVERVGRTGRPRRGGGRPGPRAAVLLAPHSSVAADTLATIGYASVAVVTLSFPEGAIRTPLSGTGFLVPRTTAVDGHPPLVTGVTYLAKKWPHLARPGDELIRASVGRYGDDRHAHLDDDELTASVVGELSRFLDVGRAPLETMVTRWQEPCPSTRWATWSTWAGSSRPWPSSTRWP